MAKALLHSTGGVLHWSQPFLRDLQSSPGQKLPPFPRMGPKFRVNLAGAHFGGSGPHAATNCGSGQLEARCPRHVALPARSGAKLRLGRMASRTTNRLDSVRAASDRGAACADEGIC